MRKQFVSLLEDAGLIQQGPGGRGYDYEHYNLNSGAWPVVKATLLSGLYPNVVSACVMLRGLMWRETQDQLPKRGIGRSLRAKSKAGPSRVPTARNPTYHRLSHGALVLQSRSLFVRRAGFKADGSPFLDITGARGLRPEACQLLHQDGREPQDPPWLGQRPQQPPHAEVRPVRMGWVSSSTRGLVLVRSQTPGGMREGVLSLWHG